MSLITGKQISKIYIGNKNIYSGGIEVNYFVDGSVAFTQEIDSGADILDPATIYIPEKSGWTFVGWREDTTASGDILTEKIMGNSPVSLYAVFAQDVTLTSVANGTTSNTTMQKYYNNGFTTNPTFTISNPTISGATFKGWSTSSGSTTVSYSAISGKEFASNTTIYAVREVAKSASKSGSCEGIWNGQNRSSFTLTGSWPNNATCTKTASAHTDGSWHPDAGGYVEFHDSLSGYFYLNPPPGGSTVSKTVTFSTGTAKSITCTIIADGTDNEEYNYKSTGYCTLTVNWTELLVG